MTCDGTPKGSGARRDKRRRSWANITALLTSANPFTASAFRRASRTMQEQWTAHGNMEICVVMATSRRSPCILRDFKLILDWLRPSEINLPRETETKRRLSRWVGEDRTCGAFRCTAKGIPYLDERRPRPIGVWWMWKCIGLVLHFTKVEGLWKDVADGRQELPLRRRRQSNAVCIQGSLVVYCLWLKHSCVSRHLVRMHMRQEQQRNVTGFCQGSRLPSMEGTMLSTGEKGPSPRIVAAVTRNAYSSFGLIS